jgi:fumarate hydratase class II
VLSLDQQATPTYAQMQELAGDLQKKGLHQLAIGGTAVGTGLNAPLGFGGEVAAESRR